MQIIITNAPKRTICNNYFRKNISCSLSFANHFYELRTFFPFLNFSCVKLSNASIGLAVTSSPRSCRALRGSATTLRSAWSASCSHWPYRTPTAVMARSVTRANTHVRCVAPESANRGERNGLLVVILIFSKLRKWWERCYS